MQDRARRNKVIADLEQFIADGRTGRRDVPAEVLEDCERLLIKVRNGDQLMSDDLPGNRVMSDDMVADLEHYDVKTVGVAWYSPETWQRLEAMPEAGIEKSYEDFVCGFEKFVINCKARGYKVEKIDVDLDHMIAWCHRNGYEIDTTGRAAYGSVATMARHDPAAFDKPLRDTITRVHH